MPPPPPVTGLSVTQSTPNDPTITIQWSHAGTNLDRFEILRRTVGAASWVSHKLGPKADFGSGPYSLVTTGLPNTQWVVRALSAAGEVST